MAAGRVAGGARRRAAGGAAAESYNLIEAGAPGTRTVTDWRASDEPGALPR